MNRNSLLVKIMATGCFVAASMLMPSTASAQADHRVAKSMASLKAMAANLGCPGLREWGLLAAKMLPFFILVPQKSTIILRSLMQSVGRMAEG